MIKLFKLKNKKQGFTLLELLVAFAIITMITSFVISRVSVARQKSRDGRREIDIKQLHNALALYINMKNKYPICGATGVNTMILGGANDTQANCGAGSPANGVGRELSDIGVIPKAPSDPRGIFGTPGDCNTTGKYVYCYYSANGATYNLYYNLETNSTRSSGPGWQNSTPGP